MHNMPEEGWLELELCKRVRLTARRLPLVGISLTFAIAVLGQGQAASPAEGHHKALADERTASLPFPAVSQDNLGSLAGVQHVSGKKFPSAVEMKGTARGLLLHARRDTRYDLLSSVALWLEAGSLLVSVRAPTQTALIANKFGDVCVTAGSDALVERGEGWLRVDNVGGPGGVFVVMHDKQWRASPWGASGRRPAKTGGGSSSPENGVIAVSPGYELLLADHALETSEVKPADGIGRRHIRLLEGARFAVCEISVDSLIQTHDLIRNLKDHGEKANAVLNEITKIGSQFRVKQGEDGFEKGVQTPGKSAAPVVRQPDRKPAGAKPPVAAMPSLKKGQE